MPLSYLQHFETWRDHAVVLIGGVGMAVLPLFIGIDYVDGSWSAIWLELAAFSLYAAGIAADRQFERRRAGGLLCTAAMFLVISGEGVRGSANVHIWTTAAPIAVFIMLDLELAAAVVGVGWIGLIVLLKAAPVLLIDPGIEVDVFLAYTAVAVVAGHYKYLRDRREAKVEELSRTDPLTGLANRRHLTKLLAAEINRADRYDTPLSVLILDLDDFKWFNDEYGHIEGDDLLERTADALRRQLRESDHLARYGGDEFVVVAPCTSADPDSAGAQTLARRLVDEIESVTLQGDAISASVGIAEHADEEQGDALLQRADRALYRAKDSEESICVEGPTRSPRTRPTPPPDVAEALDPPDPD